MTPEQTKAIEEWQRLREKKTKSPWRLYAEDSSMTSIVGPDADMDVVCAFRICKACADRDAPCMSMNDDNWKFVEFCANTLPDLIFGLVEECRRLESDNHRLRLGDMSVYDFLKLVGWIRDPKRKDPSSAFTAGAARTAAIAVVQSGVLATPTTEPK